ncbi:MAG TPA: hypothetical protein DD850_06210 [Erwinia persicina]|uniref:DUF2681 domain-containing protein n=1 Tax=Erwinia persicina TaxID=55211 RepID=A0A354A7S7_9GAMM|nr:hypothetical protein [Erwinia persicina]AXU95547.1 hypothetical protein CI789_10090 [Erwinia persicina]MBC3945769.1 hypothetical protein [Erwinia persicina]MBD8108604.1 hypothetical protein [Erwinia persicina]MBD8166104.1 hypothetical protein [Erwinia persicina]MBD8211752.1 hypothetical protein [Erwinia persicina]
MSTFLFLLNGGWQALLAVGGLLVALGAAWFGGKQVGKARQQAQVAAAENKVTQMAAVAKKQADNSEEAKNVQTANAVLNDADARRKLQQSRFNVDGRQ